MQQAQPSEQQLESMLQTVKDAMSGVIEGTASPYALIRRTDLQKLRRLLADKGAA